MIFQSAQLDLKRCPHCGVDTPNLYKVQEFDTNDHEQSNFRTWAIYTCKRCGGVVTTSAQNNDMNREINEIYPLPLVVHESIPEKANSYLNQAINTINSPSGSVMLSASAIEAMLKEIGYLNGSRAKEFNTKDYKSVPKGHKKTPKSHEIGVFIFI